MSLRRSPISTLVVAVCVGFMVYVAMYSHLDGRTKEMRRAFSSRSLMNHANANANAGNAAATTSDIISNAGVISAIDQIITSVGLTDTPQSTIKSVSEDIAQIIADYMLQKLGQTQAQTLSSSTPCYKHPMDNSTADVPIIYLVTPTYRRSEQVPELTRLAQTLLHVPAIHWIVVEDSATKSKVIAALLQRYGIPHTHLNAQMPDKYKRLRTKPRGVSNRNAALTWLRQNRNSGVLYFADDDNTYDIRLFEEMRYTKKVSMWPVGLVTKVGLSSPVVDKDGVVVDFYDGWIANRKFPVDMAGFAVSVQLLLEKKDANMPYVPGHEEDGFLKKLGITTADIEAKANHCSQILVWHTQTKANSPAKKSLAAVKRYNGTNVSLLQDLIV